MWIFLGKNKVDEMPVDNFKKFFKWKKTLILLDIALFIKYNQYAIFQ